METHLVTSATRGLMENCTIRCIDIMKTEIRNCTLSYVDIQTSTIINSKLYNCKILNSSVKTSKIVDTQLHESDFEKCNLSGCNITKSPLAFRRFLPELRIMIFRLALESEDGTSPALLVALRSDPMLYQEALKIFYKLNFFILDRSTIQDLRKLSSSAISHISKLKLDCRGESFRYNSYPALPALIVDAARVEELHVLGHYSTIQKWIKAGIKELRTVKKLVVEIDRSWDGDFEFSTDTLDYALRILGIELGENDSGNGEWMWKVPKDSRKSLKWR